MKAKTERKVEIVRREDAIAKGPGEKAKWIGYCCARYRNEELHHFLFYHDNDNDKDEVVLVPIETDETTEEIAKSVRDQAVRELQEKLIKE